jgi:1-acyl-sn-glycerol-3-phosphate acyltransferase
MTLASRVVTSTVKGLTRLLCQIDDAQLALVPRCGPLILVTNHINFLDVPLLYTHLMPRPLAGLIKAETWDNPAMGWLFDVAGGSAAIPVRRGEADREALRRGLAALERGHILALAPEGTRSGHGRLQPGQPGVVVLALHSGAPILPVVYYGGESFRQNMKRLRRTAFNIIVGSPFYLEAGGTRVTREVRERMAGEVMYQMAALLPPPYRGVYADLGAATESYLRFPAASTSNLQRARSEVLPA